MKKATLLSLAVLNFSIYAIPEDSPLKRRESRPKPPSQVKPNQPALTHEQIRQNQHTQMCNILGFTSNIFNNFVHLISRPNDRENVGNQVGNMAENIFHIVAEAATPNNKSRSNQEELMIYLASEQFTQDLTQEIIKTLQSFQDN